MVDNAADPSPSTPDEPTHVVVRPYPKIVYLYLTWLASLVCGLLAPAKLINPELGLPAADEVARSQALGKIWIAVFTFNILVIAFEFSRIRSVALAFLVIAVLLAGAHWGFLDVVTDFLGGLDLQMNKVFYYVMGAIFSIIYLLVFLNTRFNYWEIMPNEILHHHGFLGDVNRYPTRGLRMRKEITDVLEFLLLRSGTLVIMPENEERPIVLDNVIGLRRVEDKIQRILGTLKVRMDKGQIGGLD